MFDIKNRSKKMFSWAGGKIISNITKITFWAAVSLFGTGPVIGYLGVQGLITIGAISHSGIVEKITSKMIDRVL